jgi:tetratricopeptide (TPR) repeat protein
VDDAWVYAEGRRWLVDFVELAERTAGHGSRADSIPHADRAFAANIIALFASRQGDYEATRARLDDSARIWRELVVNLALAYTLGQLGMTAWLLGDSVEALDYLEESRRVAERCDRSRVTVTYESNVLRPLDMVARSRGDYARAEEYFRESLGQEYLGLAISGYEKARGLCQLARTVFLQGDVARAKQLVGEALGVIQTEGLAGHPLADCLDWLAAVADAGGRPRDAAVFFGAADAQWQASGAVRYAPERAAYGADLARVQAQVAADEFEVAWAEGRAMSRAQAVDYAMEWTRA